MGIGLREQGRQAVKIKLTKIGTDVWTHEGGYSVRRSEMGGGYARYIVTGPRVSPRASYSGSDIRTLAEAREIIAEAKASA
jgi:hypothetical protein